MRYQLCQGVSLEELDGNMVIITEKGDAATLNETGSFLLSGLIEQGLEETISKLRTEFTGLSRSWYEETEAFISSLKEKNLICEAENDQSTAEVKTGE